MRAILYLYLVDNGGVMTVRCSFCSKGSNEVGKIVAAEKMEVELSVGNFVKVNDAIFVAICDECVWTAVEIILDIELLPKDKTQEILKAAFLESTKEVLSRLAKKQRRGIKQT